MGFYDLDKQQRSILVDQISIDVSAAVASGNTDGLLHYCSDADTYIRKAAYLAIGRLYTANGPLRPAIMDTLTRLFQADNASVRQTAVNAAGEIGKADFGLVAHFFDKGLFDQHHAVRNAVIGSM